jgi:integrase
MGRRRKSDLHLPERMYERRGKFYFVNPATQKWEPLGDDIGLALAKYGQIIGPLWKGRTFGDVIDRYQTTVTALLTSKGRRENEIRALARFKRLFGTMSPDSLTAKHLYIYIDKRIDERPEFIEKKLPAPAAAEKDVRFLAGVLQKAIKWGAATANAALNIEFDARPKNTRDVTQAEYDAVYALATERMQIAMDLASNIAQRRADILAIRPKHDFTDEGILIRQGKTGTPLLIKWTPGLRATVERANALKPQIPREFLLRTRTGDGYTPSGFGANWQRLMNKATSPGGRGEPPVLAEWFKFHDFRAKAATEKAEQGTDEDAQELLGHKDVRTTRGNYIRRVKPRKVTPVR